MAEGLTMIFRLHESSLPFDDLIQFLDPYLQTSEGVGRLLVLISKLSDLSQCNNYMILTVQYYQQDDYPPIAHAYSHCTAKAKETQADGVHESLHYFCVLRTGGNAV